MKRFSFIIISSKYNFFNVEQEIYYNLWNLIYYEVIRIRQLLKNFNTKIIMLITFIH